MKNKSFSKKKDATAIIAVALSEAREEYLKIRKTIIQESKKIKKMLILNDTKIPRAVATPLPPLNFSHTGNICPKTAKIADNCTYNPLLLKIFCAKYTTKNPLRESSNKASAASPFFPVLKTFVAPIFPEPISLRSIPFIFVIIKLKGIEPKIYDNTNTINFSNTHMTFEL